jgi:hypothetical protein
MSSVIILKPKFQLLFTLQQIDGLSTIDLDLMVHLIINSSQNESLLQVSLLHLQFMTFIMHTEKNLLFLQQELLC